MHLSALFLLFVGCVQSSVVYVHDYGTINNVASTEAALCNGASFNRAVRSARPGDTVMILENETFYYIPHAYDTDDPRISNIADVEIRINGRLIFHNDTDAWPVSQNKGYFNAIDIQESVNVTLTGHGTIDGQGWIWWWKFLLGKIVLKRPIMIYFENCVDIKVEYLTLLDSPRFHVMGYNVLGFVARHMVINVDIDKQEGYYKAFRGDKYDELTPPMFPFNTDGIDVAGVNIHIYNISVTNYDDAIVIKANNHDRETLNGTDMSCTSNALVEDISVRFGVGLSIGSVSAKTDSCIKNVIFQNIVAYYPIKFIYIKTGAVPDDGYPLARIDNVTYRNMKAYNPLLWAIYLGPQQQKEPDGTGDGIWPQTNAYVNITNIHFENILVESELLRAGLLRCNISNPCRNITFKNVVVNRRHDACVSRHYVCDGPGTLQGYYDVSTNPEPESCGLVPY
jgi:hypothetical protein